MPSATNSGGSTASSAVTSASNTGTSPACASCKYQRKKCSKNCLLAPYFPHNRQQQFLNAHKLFGVSNITKMIKDLGEPHRGMAMTTIIAEADARALDPVGGCYRIVRSLQQQIECLKAELDVVLQQLSLFRARPQERQEISLGYGDLPEQQGYVVNCQNLQHQYMQQSFIMDCTYDNYGEVGNKKPMVKLSSEENHDVKVEQEGISERKSNMGLDQLLISS